MQTHTTQFYFGACTVNVQFKKHTNGDTHYKAIVTSADDWDANDIAHLQANVNEFVYVDKRNTGNKVAIASAFEQYCTSLNMTMESSI